VKKKDFVKFVIWNWSENCSEVCMSEDDPKHTEDSYSIENLKVSVCWRSGVKDLLKISAWRETQKKFTDLRFGLHKLFISLV
jgi:hypothetical protein